MLSFNNFLTEEESYQSRILKNVVLERWDTDLFEEVVISFYYHPISRQVDIARSLNEYLGKQYSQITVCDVYYFNPQAKCYQHIGLYPFNKEVFIKYEDIQSDILHIRIQPFCNQEPWVPDGPKTYQKFKPKQRTIHDVLLKVAEWRKLSQNQKVTLDVSAKMVGLSKKTLDDYFLQIKLAQTYNFDFQSHQYHGIGVLRKFVREKHIKKPNSTVKILAKYKNQKSVKQIEQSLKNEYVHNPFDDDQEDH